MKIDHVQLAMPEGGEEAARAFHADVLGMAEVEKPEALQPRGGCWFRRGHCHVHLGVERDFRAARKAHPAFVVSDLEALAERLAIAGSRVQWDASVAGVDRIYCSDPFGNRLELIRSGHGFSETADREPGR